MITTYKTNGVGAPDNSYLNLPTMFNLSYQRQSYKALMLSKYAQHKLAENGWTGASGQKVATPAGIELTIINWYAGLVYAGLAQDTDAFAESLTVEIDAVNKSRVNVVMQPKLMGQFYQQDVTLQFLT
jgi:phage tail sheath gpL-like